jgi:subtilase family serine protease
MCRLFPHLPVLQAGSDTLTAIAILVVAIGLVGLAILILFSKRKI